MSLQQQQQHILAQQRGQMSAVTSVLPPAVTSPMSAVLVQRPMLPTSIAATNLGGRFMPAAPARMILPANVVSSGLPVCRSQLAAVNTGTSPSSIPVAQLSTQGRNIIINQPGMRPGTPGSQITVPLQTLQSLQPGQGIPTGQPGHLLVKTDDGQFQILRVSSTPHNAVPAVCAAGLSANTLMSVQSRTSANVIKPISTSQLIRPISSSVIAQPGAASICVTTPSTTSTANCQTFSNLLPSVPTTILPSTTSINSAVPKSVLHSVANQLTTSLPCSVTSVHKTTSSTIQSSTPPLNATSTASAPQQVMTPELAQTKCKNFLATLLRLASEQPTAVASNVRSLIQGLIDGKVDPESFTTRLQSELNSSPQPCLGPFLRKSLPYLQQALRSGQVTIEGVRPPPDNVSINLSSTIVKSETSASNAVSISTEPARTTAVSISITNAPDDGIPKEKSNLGARLVEVTPSFKPPVKKLTPSLSAASAEKQQAFSNEPSTSCTEEPGAVNNDDDELNDVAAMGGVNLDEESQNMQGSLFGNLVGKQNRSCSDESVLSSGRLHDKIATLCTRRGVKLPAESHDLLLLVALATEQKVRTIVEKLSVIAEHRMDSVMRLDLPADLNQYARPVDHISSSPYEISQDVRSQLRFISDIDRIERRKNDEAERELLLRAAKSRTKHEDPEKEKLKAKAKELQRIEEEQMRHEKANSTAMLAIGGSKKRPRPSNNHQLDSDIPSLTSSSKPVSSMFGGKVVGNSTHGRIKRVNIRDLMFLLEQEPSQSRTHCLWAMYNT